MPRLGAAAPFSIEGADRLNRRLRRVADTPELMRPQMRQAAEAIMREAVELAPSRTGTLRSSAKVEGPERQGDSQVVAMGFGGAAASYAVAVHEFPSGYDPPSWAGKTALNWNDPGTGSKFLSQPLNKARQWLARRWGRDMRVVIRRAAR